MSSFFVSLDHIFVGKNQIYVDWGGSVYFFNSVRPLGLNDKLLERSENGVPTNLVFF